MEKKILAVMVSLVIVAALVVAFVMVAAGGGIGRAGGFTKLFDKLVSTDDETYGQRLACPESWSPGDVKRVSDTIVDMSYREQPQGALTIYYTTFWFVYQGSKWNDPHRGTYFYVPDTSHQGWMLVDHGSFSVTIQTATNLSAKYDIGDVITLESTLKTNTNVMLAFGDWLVPDIV